MQMLDLSGDKGGERNGRHNVSNSSAGEVGLEVLLIPYDQGKIC